MKHLLLRAAAAAAVSLALCGGAQATVTFDEADLSTEADVYADYQFGVTSQSAYTDVNSFTTNPSSAYASNFTTGPNTIFGTATDEETVTSTFSNPASGVVNFKGDASVAVNLIDLEVSAYGSDGGGDGYNYDFSTDAPVNFKTTFEAVDSADSYGELEFGVYDYDNNSILYTDIKPNTMGSATYNLSAGNYDFYVDDSHLQDIAFLGQDKAFVDNDDVDQYGFGSQTGSHNDTFSFSISAAPEPSAWALMIGGAAVAGLALRRRRPGAALAAG